jgi:hypothetical protein
MAECQICGQYVVFRRQLRGYQEAPPHLQDRGHVVQVCQECYDQCMEQCKRVMRNPIKCKQELCGTEYMATELARVDQQRMAEEARRKMAGVVAIQTQLGQSSQWWPQVPKQSPKV